MLTDRIAYRYRQLAKRWRTDGLGSALKYAASRLVADVTGTAHRLIVRCRAVDGLVLTEIEGSKMFLSVSDPGLSRALLRYRTREPEQTQLIREELKPGHIGIDIGANLGYYVLMEAKLVGPSGRVYAIEPVPENVKILKKNIAANHLSNVNVFELGISDRSGHQVLFCGDASNLGTMVDPGSSLSNQQRASRQPAMRKVTIETTTLDEFSASNRIPAIDFIRMDIEGHEISATSGMTTVFAHNPRPLKLFIEVHNILYSDPYSVVAPWLHQLLETGFEPKALAVNGRIHRDVYVASFVDQVCGYRRSCPHIVLVKGTSPGC